MGSNRISDLPDAVRKQRLERVASLTDVQSQSGDKAEFRFDDDHKYLQPGRFEFDSDKDLIAHVSDLVPTASYGQGIKGSVKRTGKYQRINHVGESIFGFGDPLLDSITDNDGLLIVGERRFNLYASEIRHSDRSGGLTNIDFSEHVAKMREAHLYASVLENGPFSIVECDRDNLIVASRNPREMWFYSGTTKMRFRAFDRSYLIYEKMGADIETWGHDFRTASISSRYGRFLDETHGHCFTLHTDSDSDSNDDYVDEYEWFLGANVSSGYDGVSSSCVANWHERIYSGVVAYGCVVIEF
jgi:hypothetical protein